MAYVYAALLIDGQAFGRLRPEDQAVVREVMEGVYRKFDQNGVRDNDEALRALLDSGLQLVEPEMDEVAHWRTIVNQSHEQLGAKGVYDLELLRRIQRLLENYRAGQGVATR